MMRVALAGAAAAAVLSLAASQATAATTATFDGYVPFGTDGAGIFGQAGADLTGDSFSLVFTFDLSKASSFFPGGFEGGGSAGFVDVSLTIDGVTFESSDLDTLASLSATIKHPTGQPVAYVSTGASARSASDIIIANLFAQPPGLMIDSVSPSFSGSYTGPSCLDLHVVCGLFELAGAKTEGNLQPTSFNIQYPPFIDGTPIPEPSVWSAMILGLGLVGASIRRRRLARLTHNYQTGRTR